MGGDIADVNNYCNDCTGFQTVIFSTRGLPEKSGTDNSLLLVAQEMDDFLKSKGIRLVLSSL